MDYTILDEIIVGRVEPHIYAFSTNTIPNYLKVGDTYRPVLERLSEWKRHFPSLVKQFDAIAKIDNVYFRDFAVHKFLETEKGKIRLLLSDIPADVYYSKEFFKDTYIEDLEEAIVDIKKDFSAKTQKYSFYNTETLKEENTAFLRTENYSMRPNQEDTVEAFKKAVANGHHNLLMYAVMRFGKSFTSMCCAVASGAKLVVVVSAKADVRIEWKKTVESHFLFADYDFIGAKDLTKNNRLITEKLSSGKKVVVFLTLQDLQGKTIKDKHQEVFGQDIDLLLVDETHFGARAEKYGEVLKEAANYVADTKNKKDDDDFVEASKADAVIKVLRAKNTIHLSGTPYRILMGSEFTKEDIIAFYQFTDIVNDQKKWDEEHILDDDYKEWDNPYYGFPQMVRFAFVPNESSRKKLESLRSSGTTYAFSALFKPKSIVKVEDGSHKLFQHEKEIFDLFSVIDGSKEDDCLLGFLDYDKIKEGKMCRHMVVVLPYCASCDALETLIKNNKEQFKNLGDYEIVNISGVDNPNKYKTPDDVKKTIAKYEEEGKKTITLTVNRMLTGSTVQEWDTMLFFKDTSSPQEYDQAVFRLQNQYVKTYIDDKGNTIKYNMKPQTLLVDFDPNRMFVMQERKSKIYNANVETGGNSELGKRIEEELEISPIITLNKDKIVRVKATDILDSVSNYRKDKGIKDEALEIPVDLSILDNDIVRAAIEKENEIGSKSGLTVTAHEDDDENAGDIDIPESSKDGDETNVTPNTDPVSNEDKKKTEQSLSKKIQSYYTRILLFAFITEDTVISLDDVIAKSATEDNARIIKNLGLNVEVLTLLNQGTNKFVLSDLDYKIQNLNKLSKDDTLSPEEKASVAISKFGKLGEAIVVTPSNICDDMVALFPDEMFMSLPATNSKVLDIAGTAGEYAVAIYKRMSALGVEVDVIKNSIYTIPKSAVCYELIRKLYDMLGLNIANIAKEFIATDLLEVKKDGDIDYDKIKALLTQNKPFETIKLTDSLTGGQTDMIKFEAVVGNPPYQEDDGGAQKSARPIYNYFVYLGKNLTSNYLSIIMPSRWYAGGKGLDEFRDDMLNDTHICVLHDFSHPEDIFPDTNNRGGVCYFVWDRDFDNIKNLPTVVNHVSKEKSLSCIRPINELNLDMFIRYQSAVSIIKKIFNGNYANSFNKIVSVRKPYGIESNIVKTTLYHSKSDALIEPVKCYGKSGKKGYIEKSLVKSNEGLITKWKVCTPRANNIGTELNDDNLNSFVSEPGSISTEAFIVIGANVLHSEIECLNVCKYLRTRFVRFLHSLAKASQDASRETYRFIPLQDFTGKSDIDWSKSIAEIDKKLYRKYNLDDFEIAFIESMIKPME